MSQKNTNANDSHPQRGGDPTPTEASAEPETEIGSKRERPVELQRHDTCDSSITMRPTSSLPTSPLYPNASETAALDNSLERRLRGALWIPGKVKGKGKEAKEDKPEEPSPSSQNHEEVTPLSAESPELNESDTPEPSPHNASDRQGFTADLQGSNVPLPPLENNQPGAYVDQPGRGLFRRFRAVFSHVGILAHKDSLSGIPNMPPVPDLERDESSAGLVTASPVQDFASQNISPSLNK